MIGILILLTVFAAGIVITHLIKNVTSSCRLSFAFIYGSLVFIPLLYFLNAYIVHNITIAIYVWSALMLAFVIYFRNKLIQKHSVFWLGVFIILAFISFLFFEKNFTYHNSTFFIATNLYLDYGAHIPIVRSLAEGKNYPFEVPFFAGKNLTYHFLFDFYAGILEHVGMRIDYAYNIISALTFASLFFICLDFGKQIFGKKIIGFLAFILFLLPSDLTFLNFLKTKTISTVYNFQSFLGPNTVGNFLYLNSYLNQRHLLFGITAAIAILYPFLIMINTKKKKNDKWTFISCGAFIGLLPLWNTSIFIMLILFLVVCIVIYKEVRRYILFTLASALIVGAPSFTLIMLGSNNHLQFKPGFLISDNFTPERFAWFWVLNLGVAIITIICGVVIANKNLKRFFIALLPFFIIPNLFQFSRDMFDNHKFFNLWFLFMCFFSASFLVYLLGKNVFFKLLSVCIFVLLIFSGVLGLIVIKRDIKAQIPDYSNTRLVKYVKTLPKSSYILTNGEIYDPVSVGGIKTYLGRSHYIYLYGGNPANRVEIRNQIFAEKDPISLRKLLNESTIQYVILYKDKNVKNRFLVNNKVFDQALEKVYEDSLGTIYK